MKAHNVSSRLKEARRVLRRPEVVARVGLSRSTLWRLMQTGKFPQPIKLSQKAVGWPEREIEAWLADRPRTRTAPRVARSRRPKSTRR